MAMKRRSSIEHASHGQVQLFAAMALQPWSRRRMEVSREVGASKARYQASSEGKGRDANGAPGTLDAYRPVSIWPRMGRAFPLHWQSARQAVSDFAELSGQPM